MKDEEKTSLLRKQDTKQDKSKMSREQRLLEAKKLKKMWREEKSSNEEEEATEDTTEAGDYSVEVGEDNREEEEK